MAASTHGDVAADGGELLLCLAGDGEAAELGESLLHPLHPRGRLARLNRTAPLSWRRRAALCVGNLADERVGEGGRVPQDGRHENKVQSRGAPPGRNPRK